MISNRRVTHAHAARRSLLIFYTGPLGFLLGGVGGFLYALVRRHHANA